MKKKSYLTEYVLMALMFIVGFVLSYRSMTAAEHNTTLFALISTGAGIADLAFLYLVWRWLCRTVKPKAKKLILRLIGGVSDAVRRFFGAAEKKTDKYGRMIIRGTDSRTFLFDAGRKERPRKRKMPREKDYRSNAEKIRYAYISYIFAHDKYVSDALTPDEAIRSVGECDELSRAYYPARYSQDRQIDDETVARVNGLIKKR